MPHMTSRDRVTVRSESLNKTITEVMAFLKDDGERPGGSGAKLRKFLHEKLADLAEHWYKRGVRRGHMESHKELMAMGTLSTKLRYKAEREFFDGQQRRVRVTSRIAKPRSNK